MKKVTPYKTKRNAIAALDNGGRFYNWASKARDGTITTAELRKAAGVFSGVQNIMVYLEMSLAEFEEDERRRVLAHLSTDLKGKYNSHRPNYLRSDDDLNRFEDGASAIVTGVPRLVDSKNEFTGFIMIPMTTGEVTTFTMVPIIEQYDIYELEGGEFSRRFFIGHKKSARNLSGVTVRCGGIFKELKASSKGGASPNRFLEIIYYTPLA